MFSLANLQNKESFLRGHIKLNWKLTIILSLFGTAFGVMASAVIFHLFLQLSNFNIKDYIIAAVFLSALAASIFGYRRAETKKSRTPLLFFLLFVFQF